MTLVLDHPRIRVYNLKQQPVPMVMRLKTWTCSQIARGDILIPWDEGSAYLPNFLSQIAKEIEGREWCWLSKEFVMEGGKTLKLENGSEFSFAFTRKAFDKCGPYPPGVHGASDRNFVAKVTATFPGKSTEVGLDAINLIRLHTPAERDRIMPVINSGQIKLQPKLSRDYAAMVDYARTGKREHRLCAVQLGRYGDIISVLPCLKLIANLYEPPHLMVSSKFADLLDGVSYVKPYVTQLSNENLGQALSIARQDFQIVLNFAVWGVGHQQVMRTGSYCEDAWMNGGFYHLWGDTSLKPEFDRRDPEREAQVISQLVPAYGCKPIILVNVKDAISSPCPRCVAIIEEIRKVWGDQATIIDLAGFKAHRIYDLLGLFEISKCLVCVDSAYIHMAQATEIGIVLIKNPKKWAGTVVRRNLAAETDYTKLDMRQIHGGIAQCLACVEQSI